MAAHFLLQCMKVKSEREVAQSCLTLRDPMDYSLPGSSVHGSFQAREHPYLILDLRGNAFRFSPLRIMFAVGLSYGLYYVEVVSFYAHFLKSFNHKLLRSFNGPEPGGLESMLRK